MFASLFSLIIQLTVISSCDGEAGAGSIRFPGPWHSASRTCINQPINIWWQTARERATKQTSAPRQCWRVNSDVSNQEECVFNFRDFFIKRCRCKTSTLLQMNLESFFFFGHIPLFIPVCTNHIVAIVFWEEVKKYFIASQWATLYIISFL